MKYTDPIMIIRYRLLGNEADKAMVLQSPDPSVRVAYLIVPGLPLDRDSSSSLEYSGWRDFVYEVGGTKRLARYRAVVAGLSRIYEVRY